jgi:hypothetical protein
MKVENVSFHSNRPYVLIRSVPNSSKRNRFEWIQIGDDFTTSTAAETAIPEVSLAHSLEPTELRVIHKRALMHSDNEYWKNRNQRLKKISSKSDPEFLIERFFIDGTVSTSALKLSGDHWERTDIGIDLNPVSTGEGTSLDFLMTLRSHEDMLHIGSEMTFIHTNADLHQVLELIAPTPEAHHAIDPSAWEVLPCYQRWDWYGDTEFFERLTNANPDDLRVTPAFVSLNGNRLALATGTEFSNYMILDQQMENMQPLVTRILFEDSYFYDGGGAPISWEGCVTIGLSGPNVSVITFSGDYDPEFTISLPEANRDLVAYLTDYILNSYHGGEALLLSYIGFTDLPEKPYVHRIDSQFDDPGHQITVNLTQDDIENIISRVENSSEHLKEVANALRDSTTEMGQKIYAHLDDIQEGRESIWTVINILRGTED